MSPLLFLRHFTAGEAELLFRSLPAPEQSLKGLRDRVIIALMMLEGLRRVEINRANVYFSDRGDIDAVFLDTINTQHRIDKRLVVRRYRTGACSYSFAG